jgi:hypothetical protein
MAQASLSTATQSHLLPDLTLTSWPRPASRPLRGLTFSRARPLRHGPGQLLDRYAVSPSPGPDPYVIPDLIRDPKHDEHSMARGPRLPGSGPGQAGAGVTGAIVRHDGWFTSSRARPLRHGPGQLLDRYAVSPSPGLDPGPKTR